MERLTERRFARFRDRVGGVLYERGEHFHHFEGLSAFKKKIDSAGCAA